MGEAKRRKRLAEKAVIQELELKISLKIASMLSAIGTPEEEAKKKEFKTLIQDLRQDPNVISVLRKHLKKKNNLDVLESHFSEQSID